MAIEAAEPGEITITTRSMLQVMMLATRDVEVPQADQREGRAVQVHAMGAERQRGLLKIRSSNAKARPPEAFAAVPYRSAGFWIDDRDVESKRVFAAIMLLFTLAETGGRGNLPLVTIPAH